MARRALLIGINNYEHLPHLSCCVDDANTMAQLLERDEDGTGNFECRVLSSDRTRVTEEKVRDSAKRLLANLRGGEAIFYFSGHGIAREDTGYLAMQDTATDAPGYSMSELIDEANKAGVGSILLILDCCHSGHVGNNPEHENKNLATLADGVTILAATLPSEEADEGLENSLFTGLLVGALEGGAANVRGSVTAAAVYGYVEQSLGGWQQRPTYKTHASELRSIRRCKPAVSDEVLKELPNLFRSPHSEIQMDPTYERTYEDPDPDSNLKPNPENVRKFDMFKELQIANLLVSTPHRDLYYTALHSGHVKLTRVGQLYWHRASRGKIGNRYE